ncbi:MAG: preprotein translocase subunit SecG [Campylobacterota bacterium]|nr:preprotein translocase subunit SecG [Campylobacterota bacterium]
MTSTLLIVQFVLAVIITIAILLQKSSSMGLGAYSGSNESMFGAKGPANFLTKLTFLFGLLFVLNTLFLGYLYNQDREKSVVDNVQLNTLIPTVPTSATTQAPEIPSAPAAPIK